MKQVVITLFLVITILLSPSANVWASMKGPALLESRCNSCHMSKRAISANKSHREWDISVSKMLKKED
jgi:hypothetical protein